jgi:hypothetical protein
MHDGPEVVITVGAASQNAENEIDLRRSVNDEGVVLKGSG